jgi:hypothetical protein
MSLQFTNAERLPQLKRDGVQVMERDRLMTEALPTARRHF